jgi:hypothetical protein
MLALLFQYHHLFITSPSAHLAYDAWTLVAEVAPLACLAGKKASNDVLKEAFESEASSVRLVPRRRYNELTILHERGVYFLMKVVPAVYLWYFSAALEEKRHSCGGAPLILSVSKD